MSYLRLLYVFVRIGLMNEMAYRANFYVQVLQSMISLGMALAGLEIIFDHTQTLGGWHQAELVALLGVYFLMNGFIGTVIQPSMQHFMEDVRQGTLDFTLTKPEDAQILVSVSQIRVWKLVDVLMGLIVLSLALVRIGQQVSFPQVGAFALTLAAGGLIVYSFWLALATLTFWFVKIENVLMVFQGVYEAGRWPIGIYPRWLQAALTFLIPIAFAVTVPSEALVGRLDTTSLLTALSLAVAMLVGSRLFWRFGLKHYSGASA
jgi:ABC-2 type transport system permease protein